METRRVTLVKKPKRISTPFAIKKEILAVARGMKKDGFSDVEIAQETQLSLEQIVLLN